MVRASRFAVAGLVVAVVAGCGSSTHSASGTGSSAASGSAVSSAGGAGALSAEARSAATGDIPDTQAFLVFNDSQAGFSIKYPEGWTQKGAGSNVSFSDKNNVVHLVISPGAPPSPAGLSSELSKLKSSSPTLTFSPAVPIHVRAGTAVEATYTTRSAPNPVTGKSVQMIVNRYELARSGKRATIDLGAAKGVDNVDAYRMMINSFGWQ
jgi:hypothetical protein